MIDRSECKFSEHDVARPLFVRQDIIGDECDLAFLPKFAGDALCSSCDHSIRGSEKWDPIFEEDEIGFECGSDGTSFPPGEGIYGVDDYVGGNSPLTQRTCGAHPSPHFVGRGIGGWGCFLLRFSGEQELWVLALERNNFYLMTTLYQRL